MPPGFVRSLSIIQSLRPRSYEGFTQQTCLSCRRHAFGADRRQMALRHKSTHPDRIHGPSVRSQETDASRRVRNWARVDRGHAAHVIAKLNAASGVLARMNRKVSLLQNLEFLFTSTRSAHRV